MIVVNFEVGIRNEIDLFGLVLWESMVVFVLSLDVMLDFFCMGVEWVGLGWVGWDLLVIGIVW